MMAESSPISRGQPLSLSAWLATAFGRCYGAAVGNTFNAGPAYCGALSADGGVQPGGALVVDDSVEALDWAAGLGARPVLVAASPHPETGTTPQLTSLAELPACLRR